VLFAVSDEVQELRVLLGSKVTMTCSSATDVEWHKVKELIYSHGKIYEPFPSSRFSVEHAGSRYDLVINNTSLDDDGEYFCFGATGGAFIKKYRLKVVGGNFCHFLVLWIFIYGSET